MTIDTKPVVERAEGCGIFGISIHDQEPRVPKEDTAADFLAREL